MAYTACGTEVARAYSTWLGVTCAAILGHGAILRGLLADAADNPELLDLMRERSGAEAMDHAWLAMLERAVARGEAPPTAARPRVATTPMRPAGTTTVANSSVPDHHITTR